ncbi:hypothetical protein RJ639_009685 [Escallonia herrerae]|uniref:Uncharacterized protein n=1 Tax=Escallonia herrerae TaxID=1293975 RepID=A0AA89AU36_9ASTE|nr:hypothetical protein RJ639_009685 [Escallonia herrerae]
MIRISMGIIITLGIGLAIPNPQATYRHKLLGSHQLHQNGVKDALDSVVKRKSAKTYAELAQETGLPYVYVAQILKCQALLSPEAAYMLRALPGLPEDLVLEMMEPPRRSYDPF